MSSLFKGVALFVALTCGVWIAVLWRWEVTARDMSLSDFVIYLGVLPLTVFALVLLLRRASRGALQRQAAAAAAGLAAVPAARTTGTDDDTQRHATVQLLAASLMCAAGTSAAELLAAAKDGAPRPALDPELRDDDGLPVFTARIAVLDPASLAPPPASLMEAARARHAEWAGVVPQEHVQRALAALQEPLSQAVMALAPWAARFATPAGGAPGCRVRVLIGLPADWTPFEQALGHAFATAVVATAEPSAIPAACLEVTSGTDTGEELLLQADRLLRALAREQLSEPLIVAACYSAIGEDAVDAMERGGSLFSSAKRPKGSIPGEAAAALVLAGADWPAADTEGSVPHLYRPTVLRRGKSVDAPGRIGSDLVSQAISQALSASGLPSEAICSLACDADQHTARGAELHGGAHGLLPHLDSGEDIHLTGTVTGAVGAVSALLVVACAAECATAGGQPCLAVTVGDPFARMALVVLPDRPLEPGGATPAAAPAPATK